MIPLFAPPTVFAVSFEPSVKWCHCALYLKVHVFAYLQSCFPIGMALIHATIELLG